MYNDPVSRPRQTLRRIKAQLAELASEAPHSRAVWAGVVVGLLVCAVGLVALDPATVAWRVRLRAAVADARQEQQIQAQAAQRRDLERQIAEAVEAEFRIKEARRRAAEDAAALAAEAAAEEAERAEEARRAAQQAGEQERARQAGVRDLLRRQ